MDNYFTKNVHSIGSSKGVGLTLCPALSRSTDGARGQRELVVVEGDGVVEHYELWHHEGRRARMGASMMGPDFTQWHGFYEVSKHFYNKFLLEAESLLPGVTGPVLAQPEHAWKKGMTKEQIGQMLEFYEKRYGEKVQ